MTLTRIAVCLLFAISLSCKQDTAEAPRGIEITFPEAGSLQTESRLRIRGTAENIDQLEVDGEVAEVVGGEWEALVPVAQGEVTVTATAEGVSDSVTFTVDSIPPDLVVTAPERAQYRDASGGDVITVAGSVADIGTGLEFVKIGEQIVRPDANGAFNWEYTLQPGLNEITVTARDFAGNETDDIRGVIYGEFTSPAEPIDPGFDIWVDDSSMPIMEEVIEGFMTPENLMVMAAAFENDFVTITSISLAPVNASLTLTRGAVNARLDIRDLELLGKFNLSGTEFDIRVAATQMAVSTAITPFATANGQIDITFSDPVLELEPEDLSYDIADLSDEDNETLEGLVIDSARAGFGWVLSQGFFAAIYDEEILNRKISVLDKEIVFQVKFEDIDVFTDGLLVRTSITMPVDKWPEVRDAPGALNRVTGPSSGYEPVGNMAFTLAKNAVDRVLHGVWHSGLLHYQLDSAAFAGFDLPFELTAGALASVIDGQISGVAGPSTPAALRIRPMFPPTAEYDTENARLLIQLGELHVDLLLLPQGQEPILLATIASFFDLSVRLSIVEGIVARLDFDVELRADIAAEPEIDLDDERAEEFLQDLIALIPQVLAAGLDLRGEADVTWVTLSNPDVDVHGVNGDVGTVNLTMVANPQTLEPFEPPETP